MGHFPSQWDYGAWPLAFPITDTCSSFTLITDVYYLCICSPHGAYQKCVCEILIPYSNSPKDFFQ